MILQISLTYVQIVKRVAHGLSREDGEELARGLYCIRPHERFTTHLLGSAWLCYAVMLAWFWAPIVLDVLLEQSPAPFQVWDYERTLAEGATANALSVWKVCARHAGIVRALARPTTPMVVRSDLPVDGTHWQAVAALLACVTLAYAASQHPSLGLSTAAFTPFYLIGGGTGSADINAGSSIGAAQAAPSTGGSWTNATNTFVATGGTPFAATIVGDYVSIYPDGNTVTGYVAQVTTVVSSVSVILSATIKYGTAPTDGAANRSAVAGGSWNTEQVLAAGGLATTTVPQSTKINIKQATYTVAASRTISMAGATTTPLWFSGYNTTPGDLDADITNSLTKPSWAMNASFALTISGAYQVWSSVSIPGNRSGTVVSASGTNGQYVRMRVSNTSANAAAIAHTNATSPWTHAYCWFSSPVTLTSNSVTAFITGSIYIGCITEGGGLAGWNGAGNAVNCLYCIGVNNTGAAFLSSTGALRVYFSTVYAASVDAVKWTGTPSNSSCIVGLLAAGVSGGAAITNGINNNSGTNTATIFRSNNDYYNVTNPEVGFGDSFAFFPQTDSAFPLTSSTNLTPLTTSNAYLHGFPGVFEGGGALGSQVNGGLSIGAVQPTPTTGGGAVFIFGG